MNAIYCMKCGKRLEILKEFRSCKTEYFETCCEEHDIETIEAELYCVDCEEDYVATQTNLMS